MFLAISASLLSRWQSLTASKFLELINTTATMRGQPLLARFQLGLLVGFIFDQTAATQFFTSSNAPAGLSAPCSAALTAELPCSRLVPRLLHGYYYSESILSQSCTSECDTALRSWEQSIVAACEADTWDGYDDAGDAPLAWIPAVLRYQYSLTCLRDNGRWCNVIAAGAALFEDPGSEYCYCYGS